MRELDSAFVFKQVIEPTARGRVKFCLNSIYGYTPRIGYQVSPNFLAHREAGCRGFTVTHKRSGRYVTSLTTLADVTRIVRKLEKVCDWSRVKVASGMSKRASREARAILGKRIYSR